MRIVGGIYKGRIFTPGKSFKARPTTDFAKENLFNILENSTDWENTVALDLYSGTGSISYELISRGCREVTAVEINFRHYQYITEIKKQLNLTNLQIIKDDALRFIQRKRDQYNLIFADPPYDLRNFAEIPVKVLEADILAPGGIFIIEHGKTNDFGHIPGFTGTRIYGSVNFSFFGNK